MRIAIGADHAGLPLKSPLIEEFSAEGHVFIDLGTHNTDPVDYPDIARAVGEAVILGRADRGIVLCGSAQGASVASNKLPGIRAALAHDTYSAHQSVEHDDCNVLCLGARVIGPALAAEVTRSWIGAQYTGEERHARRVEKIHKLEHHHPLLDLRLQGQSAWVDDLRLDVLKSGEFRGLIAQGITGVTSNPTIMERSISGSDAYDPAIRRLVREGKSPREIAIALWMEDIRVATDQLRPIYDLTEGADGYASIEVDAELAYDTEGTLKEARRLWSELNRPNVMVKVPGTPAGLPAIRQLTSEGINVNITLLFSQEMHEQVMEAYLSGLEEWTSRPANGGGTRPPASVASFFVSRVDSKVDPALHSRLQGGAATEDERQELEPLLGTAAIANAKLAYQRFLENFSGPRWETLARRGARVQRPLWASTSTKDPSYRDVLYVEELVGPDTVNTMPRQTIEAFKDHGYVRRSVDQNLDQARDQLRALARHGIDLDQITEQLQQEGVEAFASSFDSLLQTIARKRDEILSQEDDREQHHGGAVQAHWEVERRQLAELGLIERIWRRDPAAWSTDPAHTSVITQRLGWLDVAKQMQEKVGEISQFVERVRADGYERAVLLGMGGSSLAPEVFRRVFGRRDGFLDLTVLDTTDPETIASVERTRDLGKTLFLVASKSGTTVETLSHFAYFWERGAGRGDQFAAITDPGTPLEALARERHFRGLFLNPADIGGRYSALTYFGLVPAGLLGLDLAVLLERAIELSERCTAQEQVEHNPGFLLGTLLSAAARAGRDKVTFALPPELEAFGLWGEQLLAESTGKSGLGLIPIAGESLGSPDRYGSDRLFVALDLNGKSTSAALGALAAADHPTAVLRLRDEADLAGEFFRWEFATAVAGASLGVDPFDEPNVQEAKDRTQEALAEYARQGRLPDVPADSIEALPSFLGQAQPGNYLALMAYLPYRDEIGQALQAVRTAARDTYRIATTVGFGPRFLHSTGQLHKGGPNSGLFLQLIADDQQDLAIPGATYSFGVLKQAQAVGDFQALQQHGRRVIRLHLGPDPVRRLEDIAARISSTS